MQLLDSLNVCDGQSHLPVVGIMSIAYNQDQIIFNILKHIQLFRVVQNCSKLRYKCLTYLIFSWLCLTLILYHYPQNYMD